jgi:hypothetical protein
MAGLEDLYFGGLSLLTEPSLCLDVVSDSVSIAFSIAIFYYLIVEPRLDEGI